MPLIRPLKALGPVIVGMGPAAQKASLDTVTKSTTALKNVVAANGVRHRIKGRSGKHVPLGAMSNVKTFNDKPVGLVKGIPDGFWSIVEHGSPPHTIRPRAGTKRKAGVAALRTPYGPRASVRHPGHRPQGRPWLTSMTEGRPIVRRIQHVEAATGFYKAFT